LEETPSWTPSIDATFGVPLFAAYTPDRAVFIGLGPGRSP
jgi:hypothetical protein